MPEPSDQSSQFRILCRVFWLRVVDLEVLSPDNDARTLLGHLAALLAGVSVLFTAPLILIGGPIAEPDLWTFEHCFFATTMTVVGVLAVLSWDSALPDRRDLLVLGTLPVRIRTVFAAKLSALAGVLGVSVLALNFSTGLIWPFLFSVPGSGILGALRSIVAYWITSAVGAMFIFCSVLCLQGTAALIFPRQLFLRISSLLQVIAFTTLFAGYLLEPSLESIPALTNISNQRLLDCLPSYWLLGLFQQLNGTMRPAFVPLAERAWMALAAAFLSAVALLLLAWVLKLRRVVEQPDIAPGRLANGRLLSFGTTVSWAIVQFGVRSLLRSRQHRLLYAFYLSVGLAIAFLYANAIQAHANALAHSGGLPASYLVASLMILCFAVLGLRLIIGIPVALRANWIFQLTQIDALHTYLSAARRAFLALAVLPIWIATAAVMLCCSPSWRTAVHLVALGFFGAILADSAILNLRKLPFTCSYLPGQAKLHLLFWGGILIGLPVINEAGMLEHRLLATGVGAVELLSLLSSMALLIHWYNGHWRQDRTTLIFEEEEPLKVLALKLNS
jgi:hypothetical protein